MLWIEYHMHIIGIIFKISCHSLPFFLPFFPNKEKRFFRGFFTYIFSPLFLCIFKFNFQFNSMNLLISLNNLDIAKWLWCWHNVFLFHKDVDMFQTTGLKIQHFNLKEIILRRSKAFDKKLIKSFISDYFNLFRWKRDTYNSYVIQHLFVNISIKLY